MSTRIAIVLAVALSLARDAAAEPHPNAIDVSPISPFVRIWAVHYERKLTAKDELITGVAYTNIKYDSGRSHAPTAIIGYRRYLWRGLHVEGELWPSYNWFYGYDAMTYFNGFELWNENRIGWTFDFSISSVPLYVDVDWAMGWGLYGDDSKPQEWRDEAAAEEFLFGLPFFNMPEIFTGVRF